MSWAKRAGVIWLSILGSGAAGLAAQGVAGAAIQGAIVAEDSTAVPDATVLVTNTATGERWRTASGAGGRFFVENLSVGGPYRVEVRAVGFAPADQGDLHVSLGERRTIGVVLRHATVELAPLEVRVDADPLINAGRTGPAQIVSDSSIARLPAARDYTQLALRSPQVNYGTFALSFSGQPDRANGLQVDGTTNNDLFNTSQTANGTIAGFPDLTIPNLESIEELQIVSAPFDVRYGSFSGGLVNAATRSGTNRLSGSVYGYFQNQALTGRDTSGQRAADFTDGESGITLGGPLVRDRLAFFVNAELRRENTPQPFPTPTASESAGPGVDYRTLVRFRDILRDTYGVDPGSFESRPNRLPSGSVFGKLTAQLGVNSRLDVSHTWFHADQRFEGFHGDGGVAFSSNAVSVPLTVNATRVNWTTAFRRRWTNELLLARVHEWNSCVPESESPAVQVATDAGAITAGASAAVAW